MATLPSLLEPHHITHAHDTSSNDPRSIPTEKLRYHARASTTMSGAPQGSKDTKSVVSDSKNGEQPLAQDKKPTTQLEEDDEFEDFPVEGEATRVLRDAC